MSKQHPWEKEYSEQKLVTLGTEPSEDTKRFLKWLKKEKFDLENKVVLDAGCGNGKNAFYFAEKGARVAGYDVAKNVVALAQKRAVEEGWKGEQVKFFVHDMSQSLPQVETESVDVVLDVTSSNALTSAEREIYLNECFRVLKKGGYMFVRTLCKDGDENAKYLIKNYPGPEKDMYKLLGTDIVERAFAREDLLSTYKPYAEIKFLERIFHYPTFEGRIYKRAYWIMYLQK